MGMLMNYYKDICKKRQEELLELYSENHATNYRWQDIVEQAEKSNKNEIR